MPGASYVVEVTETNFESVMRLSLQHPVVVELYSPRVEGGQALSDALVQLANEAGGPDNITVALARNAAPAS